METRRQHPPPLGKEDDPYEWRVRCTRPHLLTSLSVLPTTALVMLHTFLVYGLILLFSLPKACRPMPTISDQSVKGYLTERTCWWNEICKEEFQNQFKCKCPLWSFCRSEGRYYSAYCSMTNTGYIWTQPERTWSVPIQPRSLALAPGT